MGYTPPVGPASMWFVAHGDATTVSIDFPKQLTVLPEQDYELEPEFELLQHYLPETKPETKPETVVARVVPSALVMVRLVPPALVVAKIMPEGPRRRNATTGSLHTRKQHTPESDAVLLQWVKTRGMTWRRLASHLGGRPCNWTDDVVRNRWLRLAARDGIPVEKKRRKEPRKPQVPCEAWSTEDDARLLQLLHLYGSKWSKIAKSFPRPRTPHAVRNRANRTGLLYQSANTIVPRRDHDDGAEEGGNVPPCVAVHDTPELARCASAASQEC